MWRAALIQYGNVVGSDGGEILLEDGGNGVGRDGGEQMTIMKNLWDRHNQSISQFLND